MSKKIKVTQVSRFAHPHIGGIEAVIEQINDSLPNDEYEKEVICCSNTEKSSVENGVKYTRCRYLFDFAANSISPQLFFKMMFLKTDILHFHMPVIQNVVIWFILYHLGLLRYKKLYITYHSDIVGYDKYMKYFWGMYNYFLFKVDHITVLSPNLIESSNILNKFKNKCVVIPYGLDLSEKDSQENNIKDLKNRFEGKKILFSCGRLVKYKGFIYAIQAMKNVENAVYLVCGSGPLREEFEEYIKTNNLSEKVILLGYVSDEELCNYFKACDIYVFPSVMQSEAFGIVQLEAMKYEKPVINTNLKTGVNYVSIHNETGITVEPTNVSQLSEAINCLCKNDELKIKFGNNARKRVEEIFDYENIKKQYFEFFRV